MPELFERPLLTPQEEQRLKDTDSADDKTVYSYNYGVRLRGPLIIQNVDELPEHRGFLDEGRILYLRDEGLYIGTFTDWIPAGGGTSGWFK